MNKENGSDEIKRLKRKIKSLENKLKSLRPPGTANDLSDNEKLLHELREKELQIEEQKIELINKQNELEASRDKYADLYDYAPVGYLTLDRNLIVKDINFTALSILGYERRFILDFPFMHFLAEGQSTRFFKYLYNCKNENKLLSDEFIIRAKEKGEKFIQTTSIPIQDYKNKVINYRISILDITEKKETEKALLESEKRFRLMADASPAMIWMTDTNNELIYFSKQALEFYGKSPAEMNIEEWFKHTHPEDREILSSALREASEEKKQLNFELRKRNRHGEYKWIFNSAAPRFINGNEFVGYVGIGIDITDRKKIKEEIENSLKEKEILLKEVHHRVKNNLQIISSILSLQTHFLGEKSIEDILQSCRNRIFSISLIHEQLYHAEDFVNINLDYYIRTLIRQLLETYRNSVPINFKIDIDEVNFDIETSINLGLILNELITNSLKYAFSETERGEILISLKYTEDKKDLILKVADNGPGLPADFNIQNLKSLGLEIVDSLATQLKGELKVNKNGKTEFQIIMHSSEIKQIQYT